ncbi:pyridine nucleotide-disulfide oxidoreductase [Clostridium carboxidivorans P7]|uniref:FAD-dependent pyridine nucleotide-disulphide oxidoreductase n=1 Tax=Clostridium carboxidivorans P7 TaxID=536227 RepID=C6PZS0_9CLOT|nr:FAD-dependent oxidoreductase [Clostridium carboxidivorans]AKN32622.1 pyridine nucleotide-disulfide oxidoreductase [Clostridium carboxidivorans P7]EET85270.1 FAD-dependent pyridine nucleotide-disulphide oxidoreductase [Clostridium carboxidivorans P7]EFG90159.1 pyridine nucleotide-disulfide oxidoreductase [Clostridium carboxidivorans P7]
MIKRIVIIGSGIAGVTAIKAIRETDLESEVYLIGEEEYYPYNRVRLSKGIFSQLEENNILLQKKEWYEQNNIKILVNTKVLNVNTDSQEVLLDDGSKIMYDRLLFANGSSNRIPPINGIGKNGVFTLRNLNDALEIKNRLNESKEIVVIGGGIQGLEMAWILHQHGKEVTVCELLSRLMPTQLDDDASCILKETIQSHGIKILTSTAVKEILGADKVEGILIDGKVELKCDTVIYSTGIKANIDLLEKTNIQTARGILVNNKMETNIKGVYAAGDIAEYNNQISGLWNIAIAQGRVAGYNIAGREMIYENIIPVTTLNAFGISLFSMGCIDETKPTNILVEENNNLKEYKKIFIKNNKVVGAIVIGDTKKSPLLKSSIEKEINLDEVDLSNISVNELFEKLKNK